MLTPLSEQDYYELRLRAEQSLMLLGGTDVKVKPEELLYLVEAIMDSASNEDLEAVKTENADLREEIADLEAQVQELQAELDEKEAA